MKIALVIIFGILAPWLIIGFIWNHLNPDEEESQECPYD